MSAGVGGVNSEYYKYTSDRLTHLLSLLYTAAIIMDIYQKKC